MADAQPFASRAQRRKWEQLRDDGQVTGDQFDARAGATDDEQLPERTSPRQRTVGPSRSADTAKINDRRY